MIDKRIEQVRKPRSYWDIKIKTKIDIIDYNYNIIMSSVTIINNAILNDDIIDSCKNYIYITDYDKLKIVFSIYKKFFLSKEINTW